LIKVVAILGVLKWLYLQLQLYITFFDNPQLRLSWLIR